MNFLLLLLAAFGRKTRASRTQWSLLRLLRRRRVSHAMRAKIQLFFQIARIILRILTLFAHKKCSFFHGSRYIMYGNSPRKQLNSIKMMNRKVLFWPLAAMLLTACEKGLDEGVA